MTLCGIGLAFNPTASWQSPWKSKVSDVLFLIKLLFVALQNLETPKVTVDDTVGKTLFCSRVKISLFSHEISGNVLSVWQKGYQTPFSGDSSLQASTRKRPPQPRCMHPAEDPDACASSAISPKQSAHGNTT
jgi:hypothetical protein